MPTQSAVGAAPIFYVLSGIGAYPVTLLDPDYKISLVESNVARVSAER